MIDKKNIVILFGADSSLEWGRSYQMSLALNELGHEVLHVDLPMPCIDTIFFLFSNKKKIKPFTFLPKFGLPYTLSKLLEWINKKIVGYQVLHSIKQNFKQIDVLWIYSPYQPSIAKMLIQRFDPVRVIYDCADDRVAMACQNEGVAQGKTVLQLESQLTKLCDQVFAVSENLREVKGGFHNKINVVPNGVNEKLFSTQTNTSEPLEYSNLTGKKILYVGSMECWVDMELLILCAKRLPDHSFILVGPVKDNTLQIYSLSNVYVLGQKKFKSIPNYIYYSDICIIPFTQTDSLKSSNTLKALQYISMGKPVLSTYYQGIDTYNGLVKVAKNRNDFVKKLEIMTDKVLTIDKEEVNAVVSRNSWNCRATQAMDLLFGSSD
ncbi:glycosyltransferase [Desulfogranum marinum]|uniref:glycosyltransferase n=1 Tax=Desulfogranum marinum TaxID=453220 RepID=UPI0029C71B3D|nr:glycosyltransferase [Desulfogranum marinum]